MVNNQYGARLPAIYGVLITRSEVTNKIRPGTCRTTEIQWINGTQGTTPNTSVCLFNAHLLVVQRKI